MNIASRREKEWKHIDTEVKAIIDDSYQRVKALLQGNRSTLNALVGKLKERSCLVKK
jgi:ATP-dependent Zn protease